MHVVVDTNILVSAFLGGGTCLQALGMATQQGRLLFSAQTLSELLAVLDRPKFARYIKPVSGSVFVGALLEMAAIVSVRESISVCRDPKDNMFLEAAVAGCAQYLITGDEDLLALHPFRGISILKPADFLELKP